MALRDQHIEVRLGQLLITCAVGKAYAFVIGAISVLLIYSRPLMAGLMIYFIQYYLI